MTLDYKANIAASVRDVLKAARDADRCEAVLEQQLCEAQRSEAERFQAMTIVRRAFWREPIWHHGELPSRPADTTEIPLTACLSIRECLTAQPTPVRNFKPCTAGVPPSQWDDRSHAWAHAHLHASSRFSIRLPGTLMMHQREAPEFGWPLLRLASPEAVPLAHAAFKPDCRL